MPRWIFKKAYVDKSNVSVSVKSETYIPMTGKQANPIKKASGGKNLAPNSIRSRSWFAPPIPYFLFDCTIKIGRTRLYQIKHWLRRKILDVRLSLYIQWLSTFPYRAILTRQYNERTITICTLIFIGKTPIVIYSPLLLKLFSWTLFSFIKVMRFSSFLNRTGASDSTYTYYDNTQKSKGHGSRSEATWKNYLEKMWNVKRCILCIGFPLKKFWLLE